MAVTEGTVQSTALSGSNGAQTLSSFTLASGEKLVVALISTSYNLTTGSYTLTFDGQDLTGGLVFDDTNAGFELNVFIVDGLTAGTGDIVYDPDNSIFPSGAMIAFAIAGGGTIVTDQADEDTSWTSPLELTAVATPDADAVVYTIFGIEDTDQVTITLDPDASGATELFNDDTISSSNLDLLVWKESDASSVTPDLALSGAAARQWSAYTFVVPDAGGGGGGGGGGDGDTLKKVFLQIL